MSPFAALVLDWVITALWPLIGDAGTRHYSGVLFASAGLGVGLLVLSPWLAREGRWRRIFSRELAPALLAMGFLGGVATMVFVSALRYTTPANAAIMAQVEVLYSALLCAWLLREPLSWRQGAAGLLVVAGTGLVMLHDLSSPRWKGDLMILATPWLYQLSHVFAKRLPKDLDPVVISGGRVFYGILTSLPFCAMALAAGGRWSWAPGPLGVLALQGVLMSSLNFVLWYRAILHMDLAKATTLILSYPALTVLFSWALGRESVGAAQLAGLALTFSGAVWISRLILASQKRLDPSLRVPPEAAQV